jgi:putative peptidoglycan lipid II flippase
LGLDQKWGVAGLTASAGVAGWIEFTLLRRKLNKRIGWTGLPIMFVSKLWLGAAIGAGVAWGLKLAVPPLHPLPLAIIVLGGYGVTYFLVTSVLRVPESETLIRRLWRIAGSILHKR